MAATPELVYWDGRGRAEIIRIALSAANIQFKEVHLETREEFLALCPELLFQQLPLLRIDGMSLVQTSAIIRFLARKANLLGANDAEIVKVEQLYEGTRDMYQGFMAFASHPDDAVVKEPIEKALTKYLPIFNKVLADNGSTGYLVGSKLTIADIGLFEVIQATVDYFTETRFQEFPEIVKFYKTLTSLDWVRRYLTEIRKKKNDVKYWLAVKASLGRP